jgi:hypothetical protein
MFVKIDNNNVSVFPYSINELRSDQSLTSFPKKMTAEELSDWNVYPVSIGTKPEFPSDKTAVLNNTPDLLDGIWTLGWTVRDWTSDELDLLARNARDERDQKLSECDWTQLPDSPLDNNTKESWATYRTALRDITNQAEFPTNIIWPTAPQQ